MTKAFYPFVNQLSRLNKSQKEQITSQILAHMNSDYCVDMKRLNKLGIDKFIVLESVMRPDLMTSFSMAQFLHDKKELFKGKKILDMGCGSGILGLTLAINGASKVIFSDISERCCVNTRKNISINQHKINASTEVIDGDLFENHKERYDWIIFNHPFFADNPIKAFPITYSMLNNGKLIKKFFEQVSKFSNNIIMPFYSIAGNKNDPSKYADKYNFQREVFVLGEESIQIQKGQKLLYQLTKY